VSALRSTPSGLRAGALRLAIAASASVVAAALCLLALGARVEGQVLDLDATAPGASLVYPPHGFPGRVAHDLHAVRFPCDTCHGDVAASTAATHDHTPRMEQCADCHAQARDTDDPDACAFCHTGYRPVWGNGGDWLSVRDPRFPAVGPPPARPLRPNLHFSHAEHAGTPCADCHGAAAPDPGADAAASAVLPLEVVCRDCHARPGGGAEHGGGLVCATCHPTAPEGQLQTWLPADRLAAGQRLRPRDHDLGWLEAHGRSAQLDPAECASCHTERDCLACHAPGETGAGRIESPHPPGFREHHGADARREQLDCASCHAVERFCVDCHRESRVGDEVVRAADRFHDPGWVEESGGAHAFAARRNLTECVSCHQEETCVTCHAAYDPHGAAFLSRCAELLEAAPQMCARCHEPERLGRLAERCR
jgi:hypothetical protein